MLGREVIGERVDGHDRRDSVQHDVLESCLRRLDALEMDVVGVLEQESRRQRSTGDDAVLARVDLQRTNRCHDHSHAKLPSPEVRHLMLKKRSAPMSAPKPASVMRNSPP